MPMFSKSRLDGIQIKTAARSGVSGSQVKSFDDWLIAAIAQATPTNSAFIAISVGYAQDEQSTKSAACDIDEIVGQGDLRERLPRQVTGPVLQHWSCCVL